MYIYDEAGLLRDKVRYQNIIDRCGRPEAVSENGHYMLLMKQGSSSELHIVKITVTGLHLVMSIDLKEHLTSYMRKVTGA